MAIVIKEILSNDINLWDKINFNFDQILLSGGGPIGPTGATGEGLPGERGKRGLNIYTFSNLPQNGDTFKGDIYIGSPDAVGFDRGKVYIIGSTGATSGTYSNLNLTGATGATGATGPVGYSGGIELYKAGEPISYGATAGLPILSEVDGNNNIIGIGATGINDDEIGFMIPIKQRVGYIFANKYFSSAQNNKFLNLNRYLSENDGIMVNINTDSTFKNLTPKSIYIQDELNRVTNNGISFGAYSLKPSYSFGGSGENDNGLNSGNASAPRLGFSTSATSDFIDFVNFGFRLNKVSSGESLPFKYVTEYLIKSESIPITISAGGIKTNINTKREPADLTFRGNRIIFETYNGNSGAYATDGTFINNTPFSEANKILFKSPSFFNSSFNVTNNIGNIITHTSNISNKSLLTILDTSTNNSNITLNLSSLLGTGLKVSSPGGTALSIEGLSNFMGNVNISNNLSINGRISSNNLNVLNSAVIKNATLTTNTVILGPLGITGALNLNGTSIFTGIATFNDNVNILTNKNLTCGPISATSGIFSGPLNLNSTLGVTGAALFKNNISVDGVIGIGTSADSTYKLKIVGDSYFDGGLSIGTGILGLYKLNVVGDSKFESPNGTTVQINNIANNKALHIAVGRSQFEKVGIGADNTSSDILRVTGNSYFSGTTTFNSMIILGNGLTIPNGVIMTANYARGNISGANQNSGYIPAVKAFGKIVERTSNNGPTPVEDAYNIVSAERLDDGRYRVVFNFNLAKAIIQATCYDSNTNASFSIHVSKMESNFAEFTIDNNDGSGSQENANFFVTVFSL